MSKKITRKDFIKYSGIAAVSLFTVGPIATSTKTQTYFLGTSYDMGAYGEDVYS